MEERHEQSGQGIIEKIRSGDARFLKSLYYQERSSFVGWALKHHRLSESEALDIYQSSFTIMYTNIKNEKLTAIESTLSTYLIGIGKNLIRKHFNTLHLPLDHQQVDIIDDGQHRQQELYHQQAMIRSWLEKLGNPCKKILVLYYYRKYSMESIAREMGYKSESVAKKKKCLCLKSLRDQLVQKASPKNHE